MHSLFSEMANCPKIYSKIFHVTRFRRNALYEPEFFSNCVACYGYNGVEGIGGRMFLFLMLIIINITKSDS